MVMVICNDHDSRDSLDNWPMSDPRDPSYHSGTLVHFAKSTPIQPNPIHGDHVYSNRHPIQSIVARSGENTGSCNTKMFSLSI